jgi:hypothetical protein
MKFLNIFLISFLKSYVMKEYDERSEKLISKILILHFKIDEYRQ